MHTDAKMVFNFLMNFKIFLNTVIVYDRYSIKQGKTKFRLQCYLQAYFVNSSLHANATSYANSVQESLRSWFLIPSTDQSC